MDRAVKWMGTADNKTSRKYKNERSVIVEIDIKLIKRKYPDVANSAYDLSNSSNRNHFLKNTKQKSFARAYSEIVFEHDIPSEAVSVCYTTKDGYVNSENKKAHVIPAISSEAVLPRTTQSVIFPSDSNNQLNLMHQNSDLYSTIFDTLIIYLLFNIFYNFTYYLIILII